MANEPILTLHGNLTADPELRFTPSGAAVANFTVACTPRTLNRQTDEWVDGETIFMRCAAWKELAENVAESLTRGLRVSVTGRVQSRTFDHKEGHKVTVLELQVDEVGPSLRNATAVVTKKVRGGGGQQQSSGWGGNTQQKSSGGWGA